MNKPIYRPSEWHPFAIVDFWQFCHKKKEEIKIDINNQDDNYLLSMSEEELINYFIAKYTLPKLVIDFDNPELDHYDALIRAEFFPGGYGVRSGEKYEKQIICYHINIQEGISMINMIPSSRTFGGIGGDFELQDNSIIIKIINFNNNSESIKAEYGSSIRTIKPNCESLNREIDVFNQQLEELVKGCLLARKQSIVKKSDILASLGVPLRKNESTPKTFSVPKPMMREKIIVKPLSPSKDIQPEPSLSQKDYELILKYIQDTGKNLERLPSLYDGKGEEDLRDYMLFILDPNFQMGSATGETFNKSGKTDIQLRYDSSVVFIAECKFWTGPKGYLDTISQLFGYLTWRDNKAAVIMFVKQKDISAVLSKIKENTPLHDNYLGDLSDSDENRFNYRFHINGDKNREVKLAIMIYHLPEVK